MKIFSIYDLPPGSDAAEFLAPGAPFAGAARAFVQAGVRFYARGEESSHLHEDREIALVILQGRGRVVVDDIAHPVSAGDVILLRVGEAYHICADEVNPPAVLVLGARVEMRERGD